MDMMDSGGHADEGEREGEKGRQGDAQAETLRTAGLLGERLVGGWVIECGGWRGRWEGREI